MTVLRLIRPTAAIGLLVLCMASCQSPPAADQSPVIARIDDRVITADEFRLSYELGFPNLKDGVDPRRTYLDHMIDEKLLAMEGFRAGLDQNPAVIRNQQNLREELLVGQVFTHLVDDEVVVSDHEIEQLRRMDHVSFRLRVLPAADHVQAEQLRVVFVRDGFEQAVAALNAGAGETRLNPSQFETGLISWSDIDPKLLDEIVGLSVGAVSFPIRYRKSFLIVQVVDIQQSALTEQQTQDEREHYQQILFQKKAKARARQLVKNTMEPSDLRLKSEAYRRLENRLWRWLQAHDTVENLFGAIESSDSRDADSLRAIYDDLLMETRNGHWTTAQFLKDYPYSRYPFSKRSFEAFQSDFYDGFGLLLRDRAFLRIAESAGYGDLPDVGEEIALWTEKWVYQELVRAVADTVSVSDADLKDYFARHRSFWHSGAELSEVEPDVEDRVRRAKTSATVNRMIQTLRKRHTITVDSEALAGLDLSDAVGQSAALLMVMKGHSGRPAYPVVDPAR